MLYEDIMAYYVESVIHNNNTQVQGISTKLFSCWSQNMKFCKSLKETWKKIGNGLGTVQQRQTCRKTHEEVIGHIRITQKPTKLIQNSFLFITKLAIQQIQ